jgi:hypothetical protein
VAFSFLQDNGGLTGFGDVSDQTLDTGDGGSAITSALENIGVNFAAGAANVGVAALGNAAGVTPGQLAANASLLGYNSALLTSRPGSISPFRAATGVSSNVLVFGGLLIAGLVVYALVKR